MLEVMKIMGTSFRRSQAHTAPNPPAVHCQPTPPPETPGHSQANLGQSLVGSLLLSPGSWWEHGSVCTSRNLFPQSCVRSRGSVVGQMTLPVFK